MRTAVRFLLLTILTILTVQSSSFAMEWEQLDSMRLAVQQQNYRGEYLHRRGDQSNVYTIIHRFHNGVSTELLRQLDGDMIEVLRKGQQVICYLPKESEKALSHAVPAAPFSQVNALDLQRISANYKAKTVGTERVAGFETEIIELQGDQWRYRQRLWLEKETKLLLQSELLSRSGDVLEHFRFTRVELGVDISPDELIPSLAGKDNVVERSEERNPSTGQPADQFLTHLGWVPSGYQLTHSERNEKSNSWLEQRTFSDGLTSFSVFVEPASHGDSKQSALAKMGATSALMTMYDGHSVTIIGEIPSATAKAIADELFMPSSI